MIKRIELHAKERVAKFRARHDEREPRGECALVRVDGGLMRRVRRQMRRVCRWLRLRRTGACGGGVERQTEQEGEWAAEQNGHGDSPVRVLRVTPRAAGWPADARSGPSD